MDVRSFSKPESKKGTTPATGIPVKEGTGEKVTQHNDAVTSGLQDPFPTGEKIIQEYLEYLAENDIHKEDVLKVLDSIISTGDVYWQFNLLGKIPVTFKMRRAWVNELLMDRMDKTPPKTIARFHDILSMYNLAGSLVQYGEHETPLINEEQLHSNVEFVSNLPFIMLNRLIKQLSLFDRVVAVATSDWAVENFSEPQSEK